MADLGEPARRVGGVSTTSHVSTHSTSIFEETYMEMLSHEWKVKFPTKEGGVMRQTSIYLH